MPPKVSQAPTKRSRGRHEDIPDPAPLGRKPPKGKRPRFTQDDETTVPTKSKKTKRGPESNPKGEPPSKKKKKNAAGSTEAHSSQGGLTNPLHDLQSVRPEGKKPKSKKGSERNGSGNTKAAEVYPTASDNLRRRLCSLWRSDSNVITSLSDLQVHHSRETFLDAHNRYVLTEQTIMLAIAALWQGIAGANVHYSFGSSQLYADARLEMVPQDSGRFVPESNILLMPLFFSEGIINPERDDKGNLLQTNPTQHGMIAVAHKDADFNITFTFMYSPPRNSQSTSYQREAEVDRAMIHQTALEIVRRSRWLPENAHARYNRELDIWLEVPPAFANALEDYSANRNALERWNMMGHHMILNAWAYMLDIPTEAEISYGIEEVAWDPFYTITDELIDLALQGRVNGDCIKRFMTDFQYAKAESDKPAPHRMTDNVLLTRLRSESSVLMNQTIFDRVLEHLQQDGFQGILPRSRHLESISQEAVEKPGPSVPKGGTRKSTCAKKGAKSTTSEGQSRTWRQIFKHNIAVHERSVAKLPKFTDRLKASARAYYRDNLVWQAIMSVWVPLWDSGHRYAFGTEDLFSAMRYEEYAMALQRWTVGNSAMPLLLPLRGHGRGFTHGEDEAFQAEPDDSLNESEGEDEKDSKDGKQVKQDGNGDNCGNFEKTDKPMVPVGGIGHWILAIATFDKKDNRVNVRHFNSANGTRGKGIERAAEAAVRLSGWLGLRPTGADGALKPAPFTGTFRHVIENVPQQENGRDCGFHVIMSAWAALLNIPIGPSRRFEERTGPRDRFYRQGRRVINCALAGRMNTRTIQAFLNVHRFSVKQDVNSKGDTVVLENAMPVVNEGTCLEAYELGRMAPLS